MVRFTGADHDPHQSQGDPLSRNGFHPELRLAARLAPRGTVSNRMTLRIMRALTSLALSRTPEVHVAQLDRGVRVRLYRPSEPANAVPALLWMHGGGYVMGDARMDDRTCRRFAEALGIIVASVDYRLAPEHPYPAALDDCHRALLWLADLPGVDPARIAVGGLSAGGGLAAALAQRVRDDTAVTVAYQLLVYPMLDDRSGTTPQPHAKKFRLWNQKCNRFGWAAYLRDADPNVAVPARNDDLSGLPPAWIGVGSLDLFYEENKCYAQRLTADGVPCDLHEVPGAFHGFDAIRPNAPIAQEFLAQQMAKLREALAIT